MNKRQVLLALALVTWRFTATAGADDFADKVRAAAQDEANELGACTGKASREVEKPSMTPEQVADAAFEACKDKIGAVTAALEGPPANLSKEDAEEATEDLVAGSKASLIELIKRGN